LGRVRADRWESAVTSYYSERSTDASPSMSRTNLEIKQATESTEHTEIKKSCRVRFANRRRWRQQALEPVRTADPTGPSR
jgi:hypothetical protein